MLTSLVRQVGLLLADAAERALALGRDARPEDTVYHRHCSFEVKINVWTVSGAYTAEYFDRLMICEANHSELDI